MDPVEVPLSPGDGCKRLLKTTPMLERTGFVPRRLAALAVPLQHRAAPRWEPSLITQVFFRFCGMPISARFGLPSSSSIAPYTCSLSIGLSFSKGFQHATSRSCLASFDIVGLTMEMRDGALSGNIVHAKETNNSIVPLPLSELGNG